MSQKQLLCTPLYEEHLRLGARWFPFAGWEMPLQYEGIIKEHQAVRTRVGMFDVSHMGRLMVEGGQAEEALRRLVTYNVRALPPGRGHYSFICREDGGILDDIYVYRLDHGRFLLVVNAVNAKKIRTWLEERLPKDVQLQDVQMETVMVAVQGPTAVPLCTRIIHSDLGHLPKRGCKFVPWQGTSLFASRTGYTGEDGLELVSPSAQGPRLWRALLENGAVPCGLGARDTLRLEAALPLYGQDISEDVNPVELGLTFAVSLDDGFPFIGREAIAKVMVSEPSRLWACLQAEGRGIMRPGYPVLHEGREVGKITSGGYSPTLKTSIGMAFLPPSLAQEGMRLIVDVRGEPLPVQVVRRPFYRPSR